MKEGSIVETKRSFKAEREYWGLNYPKRGDLLTIKQIVPPPTTDATPSPGTLFLYFEELDLPVPLASQTYTGRPNFVEVLPPLTKSLEETFFKTNKIREYETV